MIPADNGYLKKWFAEYVSGFYSENLHDNFNIRLKEEHSLRVCENSALIGKKLNLSPEESRLAESMALLHDVGRFKQYAVYRTFDDRISKNHARLGIREIFLSRVLSGLEKEKKGLIARAIALHNVMAMEEKTDASTVFYARLLRDADKLDIWRVFSNYFDDPQKQAGTFSNQTITMELPDDIDCSPQIIEAILSQRNASLCYVKTVNDYKLTLISWVYDLNFLPSFQLLKKRGHLERIAGTLPRNPEVCSAVDKALYYVKTCSNADRV